MQTTWCLPLENLTAGTLTWSQLPKAKAVTWQVGLVLHEWIVNRSLECSIKNHTAGILT